MYLQNYGKIGNKEKLRENGKTESKSFMLCYSWYNYYYFIVENNFSLSYLKFYIKKFIYTRLTF